MPRINESRLKLIVIIFIVSTLILSFYFSSMSYKISNNLNGTAWYNPSLRVGGMGQTIYFNDSKAVLSVFAPGSIEGSGSSYPGSKYSTRISRNEYDYSFDRGSKTGRIGNGIFKLKFDIKLDKYIVYYQGQPFFHDPNLE